MTDFARPVFMRREIVAEKVDAITPEMQLQLERMRNEMPQRLSMIEQALLAPLLPWPPILEIKYVPPRLSLRAELMAYYWSRRIA